MGRHLKGISNKSLKKLIKRISKNLQTIRNSKGLTLQTLATRANIATSTLWELENEKVEDFRITTLISIADALEVDLLKLLT